MEAVPGPADPFWLFLRKISKLQPYSCKITIFFFFLTDLRLLFLQIYDFFLVGDGIWKLNFTGFTSFVSLNLCCRGNGYQPPV